MKPVAEGVRSYVEPWTNGHDDINRPDRAVMARRPDRSAGRQRVFPPIRLVGGAGEC